jgi:Na+-driven multidrug efflux pump
VLPAMMLMTAMSGAALGGGIAAGVSRALGRGDRAQADLIASHALVLSVICAAVFALVPLIGGEAFYASMGGQGAALQAAVAYSNVVFGGGIGLWVLNCLAAVMRGSGEMVVPSAVMIGGELCHLVLAPALIFGWGPLPALGMQGAGLSLVITVVGRAVVLAGFTVAGRGLAKPVLWPLRLRFHLFWEILRVTLPASVNTVLANGYVILLTGLVGSYGTAALAGFGLGARLEYLIIPLIFGFGSAMIPMVGTNIGAGQIARARRVAAVGSAFAGAIAGVIGLVVALAPGLWLGLFTADADVLAAGAAYLHVAGPSYGFLGLGLSLYFASQGAGRLFWPLCGSAVRLIVAVGGGWAVTHWLHAGLFALFAASALGIALYGLFVGVAVQVSSWDNVPVRRADPDTGAVRRARSS